MSGLSIDIEGQWLGGLADADDATFGALVIEVNGVSLTEVDDSISRSTRRSIRVPAVSVARWLLIEWWRLRWEPQPESPTARWRAAHSMAGLGGGYAWPDLRIASDGEYVQLTIAGERAADVAAIRYLRNVTVEVTAAEWERAVERFLDKVEMRLADVLSDEREIAELREELRDEQRDPALALRLRREALAGYEPGGAPDGWSEAVERLVRTVGAASADDLLVATRDVREAQGVVDALRSSTTTLDLGAVAGLVGAHEGRPWQRGARAAQSARQKLGVGEGPLRNDKLAEILGERFPLEGDATHETAVPGAFRAHDEYGSAHVLLGVKRRSSQRFSIARLLGMAAQLASSEQVLALTGAKTATQKVARSFAQELLLPWAELDALTDERGTGDTTIAWIADRYEVSEMLVETTLVNRGKLDRWRLEPYAS